MTNASGEMEQKHIAAICKRLGGVACLFPFFLAIKIISKIKIAHKKCIKWLQTQARFSNVHERDSDFYFC